jgi:pimeloyl-ACP methyl ester carboxylesterase
VISLRPPLPASTAQAADQDADDPPAVLGPPPGHGLAQLGDGVQERFASVASARHMLRKSFAHPDRMPGDELIRTPIRQMRSAPDAALLRRDLLRVERGVRWSDTERDLDRVRCPTLILWGERDRYFPVRLLARFTGRLRDVEAHTLANCGHSLHDDCPEQVYPLLTRFLTANVSAPAPNREEEHDG